MDVQRVPKVLLVEDVKITQVIGLTLLRTANCQVDLAESGKQALTLFENHAYDFVLMDIGLPDMTGITVTEEIRKRENLKQCQPVPIIALTANDDKDLQELALKSGMNHFLVKPLTKENVLTLLQQFFHSPAVTA